MKNPIEIFSLYRDFFAFLDKTPSGSDKWEIYRHTYTSLHKDFFESYFSHFPMLDLSSLKQRVERIRSADYSGLRGLVDSCPPERIIIGAYNKCEKVVLPSEEPRVYLFIGFFSPDGFVMSLKGNPVICFGLERFKDFRLLDILFCHEYAHFLLNLSRKKIPRELELKWLLLSEGVGTYFSLLVFPKRGMPEHFLFRRDRLNWCQANEDYLREIFCSGKFPPQRLMDIYFKGDSELGIPPRTGKYLGFQAVKRFLIQEGTAIDDLFSNRERLFSQDL